MWKTIVVVGAAAAIIGGAGTAALASSETATPTSSTSAAVDTAAVDTAANESTPTTAKHPAIDRLRKAVHVTWVTQDKQTTTFTTHQGIRGEVTTVSPTSITVKAADNVSQTFVVNASTKVRDRTTKAAGSIAEVKTGDSVLVTGTGTTTLTAVHIVKAKK